MPGSLFVEAPRVRARRRDTSPERGLDNVDKDRLRRFGVLPGETCEDEVDALAGEEGVEFVEKDEVRKAI